MALRLTVDRENPADAPLVLAAEVIQAGGVVVYPTDTLYGIGANALNPKAVVRVHAIKERPQRKPILVLVSDLDGVHELVLDVNPTARKLMDAFWPGPLTLLVAASPRVPEELTLGSANIGIRLPSSPLCVRLVKLSGCPLTSTSANISGHPSLPSIDTIQAALKSRVDLYLDGGPLQGSTPSTVVDVSSGVARIVREGSVAFERLRQVVPDISS